MTINTNNKNTISETMEISFRNKFEKLLTDDNRAAITGAFQKFCNLCPEIATAYLWRMTYIEDISGICQVLGFVIPQESISAFRNEFRYQYEQRHPGFLDVQVPDECQEALKALLKLTGPIVANIVCEKCTTHSYLDDDIVQHTLYLLASDMENMFFGGIRSLSVNFNKAAATYLKPFHMQIHDLLKALYEVKCQNEVPAGNKPFAKLGALVKEAGLELAPDIQLQPQTVDSTPAVEVHTQATGSTPGVEVHSQLAGSTPAVEVHTQVVEPAPTAEEVVGPQNGIQLVINPNSGFVALTAEQVLKHQKRFKALFAFDTSCLLLLRDSGFDLNEIIDKEEKIRSLLAVANTL